MGPNGLKRSLQKTALKWTVMVHKDTNNEWYSLPQGFVDRRLRTARLIFSQWGISRTIKGNYSPVRRSFTEAKLWTLCYSISPSSRWLYCTTSPCTAETKQCLCACTCAGQQSWEPHCWASFVLINYLIQPRSGRTKFSAQAPTQSSPLRQISWC